MENVEEVGDCADEGDEDAEGDVDLHAAFSAYDGQEEVEWVQEQADDADHEEDVVPLAHRFRSRVEDLVPPWPFLPEIERDRHLPEPGRGCRVRVETVHHVSGIDRTPQTPNLYFDISLCLLGLSFRVFLTVAYPGKTRQMETAFGPTSKCFYLYYGFL